MFTIRGCSPKRGEIWSCTHVPEMGTARNTMYTCMYIKTSQIYLIYESLISLNFSNKFKFFRFANMLTKTD